MTDETITVIDMLKIYGPLSLGWVFYILEHRDNKAKDVELLAAYVAASITLTEFKSVIKIVQSSKLKVQSSKLKVEGSGPFRASTLNLQP